MVATASESHGGVVARNRVHGLTPTYDPPDPGTVATRATRCAGGLCDSAARRRSGFARRSLPTRRWASRRSGLPLPSPPELLHEDVVVGRKCEVQLLRTRFVHARGSTRPPVACTSQGAHQSQRTFVVGSRMRDAALQDSPSVSSSSARAIDSTTCRTLTSRCLSDPPPLEIRRVPDVNLR